VTLRAALAAALLLLAAPARAELLAVDLELVLAIDASGSVDDAEFRLQLDGIAGAFRDPGVQAAIAKQPLGRIAVALVVWSESNRPKDITPWFVVSDPAGAEAFAATVEAWPRRIANGGTGIGKALHYAALVLTSNAYAADRMVIDLSGDGQETPPSDWTLGPAEGRAYAAARGVEINGLAILNDEPDLDSYFRAEVILGPAAFVIAVQDYEAYAEAMRIKLIREIEAEPNVSLWTGHGG
jgi:hypothetical protein